MRLSLLNFLISVFKYVKKWIVLCLVYILVETWQNVNETRTDVDIYTLVRKLQDKVETFSFPLTRDWFTDISPRAFRWDENRSKVWKTRQMYPLHSRSHLVLCSLDENVNQALKNLTFCLFDVDIYRYLCFCINTFDIQNIDIYRWYSHHYSTCEVVKLKLMRYIPQHLYIRILKFLVLAFHLAGPSSFTGVLISQPKIKQILL